VSLAKEPGHASAVLSKQNVIAELVEWIIRTDAAEPDSGCRRDVACYVSAGASWEARGLQLLGRFVVACRAARLAIHESVSTKAHINHGLAQAAILLTLAIAFGLLTLRAAIFGGPGTGAHDSTVSLTREGRNVTSVTAGVRRLTPDAW